MESAVDNPHPNPQEATDIHLARHVDAICRRFEADWRAGRRPAIGDYLGEVAAKGRAILRTELEALESELRQSDEANAAREPGSVAEAASIAPPDSPTSPIPDTASLAVDDEAKVNTSRQCRATRLARVGPTTPTGATGRRARNRQGSTQAGSCQTAKDDSGKPGVRFLARSKRRKNSRPRRSSVERDKDREGFVHLQWEETKEGDTVHGARMTIETGAEFRFFRTFDDCGMAFGAGILLFKGFLDRR
jgi:hypothetical protein